MGSPCISPFFQRNNFVATCLPAKMRIPFQNGSFLKGLLHYFSTCIDITGNNWYCFILKNVENCKKKFQRVKKLLGIEILIRLKICKDSNDIIEVLRLLKFKKFYILYIFPYFFLPKYIMGDKLRHFIGKKSDILRQIMVY